MRATLQQAVALILQHEGGYVNHPNDPGGCTNQGITIGTYREHINQEGTCNDLRNMPQSEAERIYRDTYWAGVNGDGLPPGLDLAVFDMGVNAGPKRAVKLLQRVLGVAQDGIAGPITVAAAWAADAGELISAYHDARMTHYRSLSSWRTFGRGWSNRAEKTTRIAHEIVDNPAPDEPPPVVEPEDPGTTFALLLNGEEIARLTLSNKMSFKPV